METFLSFIGIVVIIGVCVIRRMNKLRSFNEIRQMNARSYERRIAKRIWTRQLSVSLLQGLYRPILMR